MNYENILRLLIEIDVFWNRDLSLERCGYKTAYEQLREYSKNGIKIYGKPFSSGYSKFESHDEVNAWYDAVRTSGLVKSSNFQGDPYNWASWIQIELDGKLIHINPPKAKNGDNNWYSYHKDFGFYVTIN